MGQRLVSIPAIIKIIFSTSKRKVTLFSTGVSLRLHFLRRVEAILENEKTKYRENKISPQDECVLERINILPFVFLKNLLYIHHATVVIMQWSSRWWVFKVASMTINFDFEICHSRWYDSFFNWKVCQGGLTEVSSYSMDPQRRQAARRCCMCQPFQSALYLQCDWRVSIDINMIGLRRLDDLPIIDEICSTSAETNRLREYMRTQIA